MAQVSRDRQHLTKVSKFLSYVLRHRPDSIGLELDRQGWADVALLMERASSDGMVLDRALIEHVVLVNDKQRFALSADRAKIRASQGHSIDVALGLEPLCPPNKLFHGTATRFMASIEEQGIKSGNRQFVHLSADRQTALSVGARHGKPVVLVVDARGMHEQGKAFFLSENGVWMVDFVAPGFFEPEDV